MRSLAPARRLDFLRLFGEIEHSTDATAYALIFLVISAAQYLVIGRGEVTLLLLQNDSPGHQISSKKAIRNVISTLKYSVRLRHHKLSHDSVNRSRKWHVTVDETRNMPLAFASFFSSVNNEEDRRSVDEILATSGFGILMAVVRVIAPTAD